MRRIEPRELYDEMLRANPYVIDVRGDTAYQIVTDHIPGDTRDTLLDVQHTLRLIPRDRHIVVYCTCPSEATSERVARFLESEGYRADVLRGGLDAWKAAGLPTDPLEPVETPAA